MYRTENEGTGNDADCIPQDEFRCLRFQLLTVTKKNDGDYLSFTQRRDAPARKLPYATLTFSFDAL